MVTSIYISNEAIQVVLGEKRGNKIKIEAYASVPVSPNTVINGVVTDEGELIDAMARLRGKLPGVSMKKVRIVIGSSQIYVRQASIPLMPRKKMMEWVRGEFHDVESGEELLYDYTVLARGEGRAVTALLCAVKRELVAGYVELFGAMGIGISCIDTLQNSQIKLVRMLPQTRDRTFISLSFDGTSLDTALYVRGVFRISNRARLLEKRGTPESLNEIEQLVSSMIQFNQSDRSGATVTHIFCAGHHGDEEELCRRFPLTFGVEAQPFSDPDGMILGADAGFVLSDYAYTVGNLIRM